ncbi:MAG: DEAD/DEAH box helicase [Parachlamydiaceae bacterium]
MTTFADFGLDPLILTALEKMNYKEPSPIQTQAMPLILQSRDLIALAQTGSGKTAACAIPICHKVDIHQQHIQALIIVPTRELALQYATETQKIGGHKGVKAFAVYGGEDAAMQQSKLKHGVHVLVATPGRLIDFIYSRQIDLSKVNTLILDEADEMLSMGFYSDLEFIIQCLIHDHQTLLFSATMPTQIKKIAQQHMKDPVEVILTEEQRSPSSIDHCFVYCHHERKGETLCRMIEELHPKQSIIFCRSRDEVERVCRGLKQRFDGVDFLHAGLSQDIRSSITNKFRTGRIHFLVATDVAARGLDFSGITHVFIYHLADDPDIYVHRSGRTGRCEREGTVITLVTSRELFALKGVLAAIKKDVKWIGDPPPSSQESSGQHQPRPRRPAGPVQRRGR